MPKPTPTRTFAHVLVASVIYALVLAGVSVVVGETLSWNFSLGEGVTAFEAALFMAALLLVSGLLGMALIASPVVLLLNRTYSVHYSAAIAICAVAGLLPLMALTEDVRGMGVGSEPQAWFSDLFVFFAFAGACGGFYLWLTVFRHLTPNLKGTR